MQKTTIRADVITYIIYMIVLWILSLKYPPFSHKTRYGSRADYSVDRRTRSRLPSAAALLV